MSKTSIKRYLMLLGAIGLVAVASGGAGTFASFNAEVTNSGNSFATGTLILNDNGGTNTCTSEGGLVNTGAGDCDTLFKLSKFAFASTSYAGGTALDNSTSPGAITIGAVTGAAIYPGDTLTISQGANTDTTLKATSYAAVGAVTVDVDPGLLTHSYTSGATITDNNDTYLANLTLTNAGTIDASGIKFEAGGTPCTHQYTEGHSTLNMGSLTAGVSSGTTLTFSTITAGAFQAGDPVVVSEGGHYNTFIAQSASTATTVVVTAAQKWNGNYDTSAVVSGPEFNGATAQNLCSNLKFSVTEMTSSFSPDFTGAAGCAYGGTTTPVATNACDLGGGTALSGVPSTLTALSLASPGLSAGSSKYFQLAVHYTGSAFDNTYQNTEATAFSLTWHIDQA